LSFERIRNTSKKNQGKDSHYGLSCAKPDKQESEVNFLIDKQIKLLNVSFDEQKIIQKKLVIFHFNYFWNFHVFSG
jgi:hypothetical protein